MKATTAALTAAAATAFSPLALAHPGHDHAAWTSGLIHAITALALIGAGGVAVHTIRRRRRMRAAESTRNEAS